jgi:cell wall-associated NlpC family hydrolase
MHNDTNYYGFITNSGRVLPPHPRPMAHPLRDLEALMTTPQSIATAVSEQAFTKRTPVRGLRSRHRALRHASLLLAVAAVLSFVMQPSRAAAIPVSERTASWIALTSRNIALELRRSRDLALAEQQSVAGRQIDEVASLVAELLDADAQELRRIWNDAPITRKIALFSALSQVGVPYRLNADAPFIALDCSALTRYAWAQAGVEIERGSAEQYARAGRVARDEVQVGDLVWYPGHIMFSLGTPELIIHARSGERSVEIHRIDSTRVGWMRWVSPLD